MKSKIYDVETKQIIRREWVIEADNKKQARVSIEQWFPHSHRITKITLRK